MFLIIYLVFFVVVHLVSLVADELEHEVIDHLDVPLQPSLDADVETPFDLPQDVDVPPEHDGVGVVEGLAEASPHLIRSREGVELNAEPHLEDRVQRSLHQKILHVEDTRGVGGGGDLLRQLCGGRPEHDAAEVPKDSGGELEAGELPLVAPLLAVHREDPIAEQIPHDSIVVLPLVARYTHTHQMMKTKNWEQDEEDDRTLL